MTHTMQNVLEKFEFFPIKCRVQRSQEMFKQCEERRKVDNSTYPPLKKKVQQLDGIINLSLHPSSVTCNDSF